MIGDADDDVMDPNDLEFHPDSDRADELWVLNEENFNNGGSTVTFFGVGTDDVESEHIRDGNDMHFMSDPTSIAFSENGHWATGCGVQDANHQGGTFAGPSMWSSDFDIYGAVGDPPTPEVNGSHLDMLHGSPYSMGIAHEDHNAFWVYDGYHGYIVRYDFVEPHPPGGSDHSNGRIRRYKETEIERHDELPSHMELDKDSGILYVNDTGNDRVMRLDINTGELVQELAEINEPLAEHSEYGGVDWSEFGDVELSEPTGMALYDGELYISNHGTSELIVLDADSGELLDRGAVDAGIRGLTFSHDGELYAVNYDTNEVLHVEWR